MFEDSSKTLLLALVILLVVSTTPAQQGSGGSVRGRVVDQLGALVSGATVSVIASDGKARKVETNREGAFTIDKLIPGSYTLTVSATGFAPYEKLDVVVVSSRTTTIDVSMAVTVSEQVTVATEPPVNTDPAANASATVLRGKDIDALPSDSQELAAALQALAGPGAGPSGGEIFIDGFSGGKLPPADTIREIRINQNPFSSEFDRLGFGRIEIFTKPGTEELSGEVGFEFEDESLNSRNPFARNRPPFQVRELDGDLAGPIVKNVASFFFDAEHSKSDNNSLINAVVLGPSLNPVPLQLAVLTPTKDWEVSSRFDIGINEKHTLAARYSYEHSQTLNAGLGGFDLPSRAYNTRGSEHTFRLTETAVISPTVVNEARFQYIRVRDSQGSDDLTPTIRVLDSFNSGGPNTGLAFSNDDRFELQNFTSFLRGLHNLKVGLRLRHVSLADSSPSNFAGTFTFTSLAQYRNTILDLPGALPTQFSIAGGQPEARVRQTDLGLFLQDDWRVRPDLTLSLGLRYEAQTNLSRQFNFAPRFGFAYAPRTGGNDPKIAFRGGIGIFYDRFSENFTLQANRFNGVNQQQFIVTDPLILDTVVFTQTGVSNVPTVEQLQAFAQPQTTRVVDADLRVPYTIQSAIGVEGQLPFKTTVSASYVNAQTRRLLRSRNINAPINGVRPNPATGNIYQYEATGRFNQHQLIVNARSNISDDISIFSNYAFGGAKSDSDGAGTFPANSYDLSDEYGRAALDVRHRFVVGGNLTAPLKISLSPFITFRSGVPFNITTGTDLNADALFTDRPAFATDLSEFGIVNSRFGAFDPTPDPGDQIIPRNYGRGPDFFIVNLRASREFGFGGGGKKEVEQNQGGGGGGRGGINNPLGGGTPRPAPVQSDDDDDEESRFTLEVSLQVRNLFNHTNPAAPVGNLRSSLFGQSTSLAGGFGFGGGGGSAAGNRRLIFELNFSF